MKAYYYVCPRCGRTWRRFLPHPTMKCPFCEETWKTKGKKGTRSKLSLIAAVLWVFWLGVILGGGYQALIKFGVIEKIDFKNVVKSHSVKQQTEIPEEVENAIPELEDAQSDVENDDAAENADAA